MTKLDPENELTDDEWRAAKFGEEELVSANISDARIGVVTLKQLKTHLTKYGPEGILESATNLSRGDYEELEKLVRKAPRTKTVSPRKNRR